MTSFTLAHNGMNWTWRKWFSICSHWPSTAWQLQVLKPELVKQHESHNQKSSAAEGSLWCLHTRYGKLSIDTSRSKGQTILRDSITLETLSVGGPEATLWDARDHKILVHTWPDLTTAYSHKQYGHWGWCNLHPPSFTDTHTNTHEYKQPPHDTRAPFFLTYKKTTLFIFWSHMLVNYGAT